MRIGRAMPLVGLLLVGMAGVGVVTAGSMHQAVAAQAPQHVFLYVFRGHINGERGVPGPDGKGHDVFVPSTFAVKAGVPVVVTVVNYDEGAHSIVAAGLGLNVVIKPGIEPKEAAGKESTAEDIGEGVQPVTTTFTFTPAHKGVYRWYCGVPCDAGQNYWAMGQGYGGPGKEGFMAGYIVVLSA
jgi:plastocyanin